MRVAGAMRRLENDVGDFRKSQPPLLLTKLGLHQRRFGDSAPQLASFEEMMYIIDII